MVPEPSARARSGLEDVVVGDSAITLVAGETGGLAYRGFEIGELARHASFEGVLYLLLEGDPPTTPQLAELTRELASRRVLPIALQRAADALPAELPPLEALRSLVSTMGTRSFGYPPTRAQGYELVAKAPSLLARVVRRRKGAAAVAPDPELGHVANYLYLLQGRRPTERALRALETYFILLADHGMNASTFALRVVLSTQSDLASGAVAALAALKGPLHGGAPSKVSDMLDAVGDPGEAERWIDAALERKERLMGFGHRAYKTEDPRARIFKEVARVAAEPRRFALALEVERAALAALGRRRPEQRLYTNVEFWGALVLEAAGLERDLFTPTFALARTAGWTAHALEQAGANRLIRPDVDYTGPAVGRTWPTGA